MKARFLFTFSVMFLLFALPLRAAEKPAGTPPSVVAQYVGSDTCLSCHEETYKKQFESTPHFQTLKNGHGCESCHGPGSEHVAGGGDKTKIINLVTLPRAESSSRCLECHADSGAQHYSGSSAHMRNNVGCIDCHSPHHAEEANHLLAKKQPDLCYTCHAAQRAEFARPYRHRVNAGLVECADCHNVHGTSAVRQVRDLPSGDAVCFKCHSDKQGPFAYEHLPVKTEGCSSCHTPHGSTNPRLLRVSNVNLLCLQCHSFPGVGPSGPAHNQSQKYQACTMCHPMIHGSNSNLAFMK